MSISMYQASVPLIGQMLGSLDTILDKAVAYCETKKIAPEVLLGYRLAPDMHPLTRQVQFVSDQAKGVVARLAGIDVPSWADDEKTFADLKARIAKTRDFVNSVSADKIDGSEDKEIVMKFGPTTEMKFSGSQYLFHFFMPNFYFHTSTAYDILRHAGVELTKRDLMGKI
ncbi:MAG: DUF1993 domain-containing protein [Parvibaculaceae bacterium]